MIRSFFIEIVLPLILFLIVRSVLRGFFSGAASTTGMQSHQQPQPPRGDPGGSVAELKRDPVCGTYVASGTSLTRQVRGETVHFCSKECRDKFVA